MLRELLKPLYLGTQRLIYVKNCQKTISPIKHYKKYFSDFKFYVLKDNKTIMNREILLELFGD